MPTLDELYVKVGFTDAKKRLNEERLRITRDESIKLKLLVDDLRLRLKPFAGELNELFNELTKFEKLAIDRSFRISSMQLDSLTSNFACTMKILACISDNLLQLASNANADNEYE